MKVRTGRFLDFSKADDAQDSTADAKTAPEAEQDTTVAPQNGQMQSGQGFTEPQNDQGSTRGTQPVERGTEATNSKRVPASQNVITPRSVPR